MRSKLKSVRSGGTPLCDDYSIPRVPSAKELAAKAIDNLSDDLASPIDLASRKRRLLKGPEEFRDDRVDRPKAKGK